MSCLRPLLPALLLALCGHVQAQPADGIGAQATPEVTPALPEVTAALPDAVAGADAPTTSPEVAAPAAVHLPWTFTVAPYVAHWRHDPEHQYAYVFALEHRDIDNDFLGLSLFRNSFGQPSGYLYVGRRWDHILGVSKLSFKLTAGVIYGYIGEHKEKVPFNWNGYSPGLIPSLVYQFTPRDSLDVMTLGTAGAAFGYSRNF